MNTFQALLLALSVTVWNTEAFVTTLMLPTRSQEAPMRMSSPPVEGAVSSVTQISTLKDYVREVAEEDEHMVCVRYFAPWCRACKAAAPAFRSLVHKYPSIKFVDVALTKDNASMLKGLGVPSFPFAHLYHPDLGLVEEAKVNRRMFGEFRGKLQHYVDGFCSLPDSLILSSP